MIGWIRANEDKVLIWANKKRTEHRIHALTNRWFSTVTHMGGATFTLLASLLCALLAPQPWGTAGWQSLLAVVVSHIPVFIVKRKFKRLRPYQAIEGVHTVPKPLQDSSFPSGHTTAVFAWVIPLLLTGTIASIYVAPLCLVIAISVGWSRMHLGLHYPSDVAAGAIIGTATAFAVRYFWLASAAGVS